ncbi:MAG: HAMP domain-containing protein [Bacteroidetes bacterium]|nr:MAG: HAMP domain-containing protein [Bacteroidota bacterium]
MSLKAKFWIWAVSIYLVLGFGAWQLLSVNKWYFLAAEGGILLSLFLFFWFQHSLLGPIKAISEGAKLLEEQDFTTRLVPVGQKEIDNLTHVYNRMADALRQQRLQQEETHFFLQKLIQASPQGILILDFDEKIREANPAALMLFGFAEPDIKGLALSELPDSWGKILSQLKQNHPAITRMDDGRSYRIEKSAFSDRGFSRPFITLEEQTREIMALERQSYEKVIRMMSHEINNSAGAVNSMLSSLLAYSGDLPPTERTDYLSALNVSITRNEHLSAFMSNLADVVKLPTPQPVPTDLHDLALGVLKLMEPRMREAHIQLIHQLEAPPFIIEADPVQMEQVLVNILKNAMEAIKGKGIIELHSIHEPPTLFIRNNGEPITEETHKKLFTPFFSTKKHGQGVGLTLVREVLSNHGFRFRLQTKADGFTEFMISF